MQTKYEPEKYIIKNDITIIAPRSLRLITPFVLKEQNDWFEDEIEFIRHYITDGMKVLDIGANYGVYTLTMAKNIGSSGKLWAFEPTELTARYLAESIKVNKFTNISLLQMGLSNKTGKAKLFTSDNSEMNSLSKEAVQNSHGETISLKTLDYCMNKYNWTQLDFIKLDAEGEECNILKKGKNIFTSLSPLIMFEFKHGESVNLPLISSFKRLGYNCYRLIPALNILVPFNHNESFDSYQLNIFSCNKNKSNQLENEGWLVTHWETDIRISTDNVQSYIQNTEYGETTKSFIDYKNCSDKYLETISSYLLSFSNELSSHEKVGSLMLALRNINSMLQHGEQRVERLSTFSRIAIDAGERALGLKILKQLIDQYPSNLSFDIKDPFLPATKTFEYVNPRENLKEWLFSSILEQFIIKSAFSSIYNWQLILPLLERLKSLGFISNDMSRRYELIQLSIKN